MQLQDFAIIGDHAEYRPSGEMALAQATKVISGVIAFARELEVKKLLVVTTELAGFRPPSVFERFLFVHAWAKSAGPMRVAIVALPGMIDSKKFGVTVARNIGFDGNVFDSEAAALIWLLAEAYP